MIPKKKRVKGSADISPAEFLFCDLYKFFKLFFLDVNAAYSTHKGYNAMNLFLHLNDIVTYLCNLKLPSGNFLLRNPKLILGRGNAGN